MYKLLIILLSLACLTGCSSNENQRTENSLDEPNYTESVDETLDNKNSNTTTEGSSNIGGSVPTVLSSSQKYDSGIYISKVNAAEAYQLETIRYTQPVIEITEESSISDSVEGEVISYDNENNTELDIVHVEDVGETIEYEYIYTDSCILAVPKVPNSTADVEVQENLNAEQEILSETETSEHSDSYKNIQKLKKLFVDSIYTNGVVIIYNVNSVKEFETSKGISLDSYITRLQRNLENLEICNNIVTSEKELSSIKDAWDKVYEMLYTYREKLSTIETGTEIIKNNIKLSENDMKSIKEICSSIDSISKVVH